ncbi:hypothetical protein ACMWQB_32120, partial [Escherichia coli]|uniref:hypothetical protein n=1 Tax=Escherichia coli TaxID=562 RepID=UPI0039DF4BEC
ARVRQLRRRRWTVGILAALVVGLVVAATVPLVHLIAAWNSDWNVAARKAAVDLTGFDPGFLIDDGAFYDGNAMD